MILLFEVQKDVVKRLAVVTIEGLEDTLAAASVVKYLGVVDPCQYVVRSHDSAVGVNHEGGIQLFEGLMLLVGAEGIEKEIFGEESGDSQEHPTSVGRADVFLAIQANRVSRLGTAVEPHHEGIPAVFERLLAEPLRCRAFTFVAESHSQND